ncbi:MAG: FecR family protein [Planctomycetota bacterium]|nr:FecR family protein [Planctomycetota bacterium]MDA1139757.1 FecR family protein [Planctomycetota bacterium]
MSYRLFSGVCAFTLACAGLFAESGGTVFDLGPPVTQNGQPSKKTDSVKEGDKFVTGGAGSFVQINFLDNSTVKLGPNSDLTIDQNRQETKLVGLFNKKPMLINRSVLTLNNGNALINVKGFKQTQSSFEVRTPTAVAGVRGTRFMVVVTPPTLDAPAKTEVFVFEGRVEYSVPTINRSTTIRKNKNAGNSGAKGEPSKPKETSAEQKQNLQERTEAKEAEIGEDKKKDEGGSVAGRDKTEPKKEEKKEPAQQEPRKATLDEVKKIQQVIKEQRPKATIDEVRNDANPIETGIVPADAKPALPKPPDPPANQ